jgi:hypothetical protein
MQAAAANKAITSSPKTGNSPNRPYLPPLMSALDAFVESGSEERALDLLETVKPNLGGAGGGGQVGGGGGTGAGLNKKKTKKMKKKTTKKLTSSDTNQLPDPTTKGGASGAGAPTSPRMFYSNNNQTDRIKRGGPAGGGSNSDNEEIYGFGFPTASSTYPTNNNMYEGSQNSQQPYYHFPTTPVAADRKGHGGGARGDIGQAPRSAPKSAPRAGRTYKAADEVTTPDTSIDSCL